METIAAKVRFHTFAAIGSLCSIGQIGLLAAISCGSHEGPVWAARVTLQSTLSAHGRR